MAEKRYTVCLDPGHGGPDPGAVGPTGVQEKTVTLAIVQNVARLLGDAGCKIVLTRAGDVDVSLQERADIANNENADLFVSVHCNAAANSTAHGLEAYHFHNSGDGKRLAEAILDRLVIETGLESRGTKESGFAVLRLTKMTAVLVECGFLSNPTEEALLEQESFHVKCARAIADGVMKFLGMEAKKGMFKDVNSDAWYARAIEEVTRAGLMGGYPDGTFRPEGTLTRAELASVLARYLYRDGVFTDILPAVLPSVVRISHSAGIGSGVSIGGGRILTCAHVAEGAQAFTVDTNEKTGLAGKYLIASAVPGEDLALIKIDTDLPAIPFASSVAVGEPVAVIGSPLGVRQAVTVGVVSALDQGENRQFVQIDAPINPGNSGGPVVNEKGELVGIATAKVVGVAVEGFGYVTNLSKIYAFLGRVK